MRKSLKINRFTAHPSKGWLCMLTAMANMSTILLITWEVLPLSSLKSVRKYLNKTTECEHDDTHRQLASTQQRNISMIEQLTVWKELKTPEQPQTIQLCQWKWQPHSNEPAAQQSTISIHWRIANIPKLLDEHFTN